MWLMVYSNDHAPLTVRPIYSSSKLRTAQLFVLKFYGPVNPMGSCRARSVYLTTRLLGRLSPLSGNQYCAHSFARNWQLPFLNQRKGENDHRKYFMINLHERMLPTSAGVEPGTSWSPVGRRIQLSHRGRLGTAQMMIFSLVVMIGLEKCCITSACLQWLRWASRGPWASCFPIYLYRKL